MAAHQDWRLYMVGNAGDANTSVVEVEMYDAAGTNLIGAGTANASGTISFFPASAAFDGSGATRWAQFGVPSTTTPFWLSYAFPGPVDVAVVRVAYAGTQTPAQVKMQYSDDGGVTWIDATGYINLITAMAWSVYAMAFTVNPPLGGYYCNYRLRCTSVNGGGTTFMASEIAMKTVVGGATIVNGSTYASTFGAHSGSNHTENTFDSNLTTYAEVNNGGFMGYAFKAAYKVIEVDWTAVNSGSYVNTGPENVFLEGSNDAGNTWVTITKFLPATWTAAAQVQVLGIIPDERGNLAYNQVRANHRSGGGYQFQMFGGGVLVQGHAIAADGNGNIIDAGGYAVTWVGVPTAHGSLGTPGQMAYDPATGKVYVCYNFNAWARFDPDSITF